MKFRTQLLMILILTFNTGALLASNPNAYETDSRRYRENELPANPHAISPRAYLAHKNLLMAEQKRAIESKPYYNTETFEELGYHDAREHNKLKGSLDSAQTDLVPSPNPERINIEQPPVHITHAILQIAGGAVAWVKVKYNLNTPPKIAYPRFASLTTIREQHAYFIPAKAKPAAVPVLANGAAAIKPCQPPAIARALAPASAAPITAPAASAPKAVLKLSPMKKKNDVPATPITGSRRLVNRTINGNTNS